jgi:hypothetical protein
MHRARFLAGQLKILDPSPSSSSALEDEDFSSIHFGPTSLLHISRNTHLGCLEQPSLMSVYMLCHKHYNIASLFSRRPSKSMHNLY